MIKKSRLRWFGHVEQKDYNDWVKRCTTWKVEEIRQTGRPKKTWWDCAKDVCLFVCLGFNGTFSTNRLYRAIRVGKYYT